LLKIRTFYAHLGSEHARRTGLGVRILLGMNKAAGQSPYPGKRRSLTTQQHGMQLLLHQGQQHHIHTDLHRFPALITLIHFFTNFVFLA
jgi:hypothetical protein